MRQYATGETVSNRREGFDMMGDSVTMEYPPLITNQLRTSIPQSLGDVEAFTRVHY